jgi:hypothetical protein
MAPKIRHPKPLVKRKNFVAQGTCGNSTNISGYLVPKAGGANIPGTKLDSNKKKHWGLVFKNIKDGAYKLVVNETTAAPALAAAADTLDFTVAAAPPPPPPGPDITFPATGDSVTTTFYPYGTSGVNIVDPNGISFYDPAGANQEYGTLLQQIDSNGFWYGSVEDLDAWTQPGNYNLDVSNGTVTTSTGITISP